MRLERPRAGVEFLEAPLAMGSVSSLAGRGAYAYLHWFQYREKTFIAGSNG